MKYEIDSCKTEGVITFKSPKSSLETNCPAIENTIIYIAENGQVKTEDKAVYFNTTKCLAEPCSEISVDFEKLRQQIKFMV